MDRLMSWRLSRICERSAWKKVCSADGFMAIVGLIFSILCIIFLLPDKDLQMFVWVMMVCGILFILQGLSLVLCADDYFSVQMGPRRCKVYVYRIEHKYRPATYEILIQTKKSEYMVFASEYNRKIYAGSKNAFIYSSKSDDGEDVWMLINKYSEDIQELGQRVGENVFLSPKNKADEKIILNILQDDGYTEISADRYTCENILVPEKDEIEVIYNGEIIRAGVPNEYLIIKDDDRYQVWGIYSDEKHNPSCYALSVSSVIFHEGMETVILLGKHFEYTELYHGFSLGRKSTTLICEVYDKEGFSGVYGTVRRFNPKTNTLDKLYDGAILGILFEDGEIYGESGQVFKP